VSASPASDVPPDDNIVADPEPTVAPAPPQISWAELGTDPRIVEALAKVGITAPFPIQAMTLPVAIEGHDIIGQAKTGTGKTLGFGIPLLHRVLGAGDPGYAELDSPGSPQALVIVPTRELAGQVAQDLKTASALMNIRILTVYGGRAYEPQVEALKKGIEVVVGTPGRLLDLAQQGLLKLGHVRSLVLDEADEMLDLGFLPDVEKLMSLTPDGRQTMLFSATMPGAVVSLARRYMTQPTHIRASDPTDTGATVLATAQFIYRAHAMDKVEMVARLLQAEGRGLTIIFTRTKRTAAKVADELSERGFAAAAIHGDLGQGAREQALRAFRNGKVDVLVATDVAARGIDVENVTHVVNYGCPEDEKTYLHRIGRTGRAGNTGVAVTFVDWDDLHRWTMINKALDLGIPDPVETYSTSPNFFEDLHIPEGVKGTLPRAERTRAGLSAEVVEDLGETGKRMKPPTGGRSDRGRSGGSGGSSSSGGSSGPGRRSRSGGDSTDSSSPVRSSGPSGAVDPSGSEAEGDERPRRTRARRRTRSGAAIEGQTESSIDTEDGSVTPVSETSEIVDDVSTEGSDPEARRRRRRRGGRGRGSAGAGSPSAEASTQGSAEGSPESGSESSVASNGSAEGSAPAARNGSTEGSAPAARNGAASPTDSAEGSAATGTPVAGSGSTGTGSSATTSTNGSTDRPVANESTDRPAAIDIPPVAGNALSTNPFSGA
jgi:superfamily II DNA/RNA helicase